MTHMHPMAPLRGDSVNDLYARAAAVFGSGTDGVFWPYDVSGIDRSLRRKDPEAFEKKLAELTTKREVIVTWAEKHGLKKSTVKCCPWWLTRKTSRACTMAKCTRYGTTHPDSHWLDHGVCWLKDGKPAVISSAPYNFADEDQARLTWWTSTQPELSSAQGEGWYGYGTRQILIWRSDRIATVEPASLPKGLTS